MFFAGTAQNDLFTCDAADATVRLNLMSPQVGLQSRAIPLRRYLSRIAILVSLPIMVVALYLSVQHIQDLRQSVRLTADDLAENVALALDVRLKAIIDGLNVLAASPLLETEEELQLFYETAQGFRDVFGAHVILADLDSNMVFNTRSPLGAELPKLPVPGGHAAVPDVLRTGEPSVGDMFMGPIAKETLIAAVVPVTRAGEIQRLLLSIPETRQFQNLIDNLALPDGWVLAITDSKGDLIAGRGSFPSEADSEGNDVFYRRNDSLDHALWSVRLDVPYAHTAQLVFRNTTAIVLMLVIAAVATFFVGLKFSGRLSSQVRSQLIDHKTPARRPILEFQQMGQKLEEVEAQRDSSLHMLTLFIENVPAAIAMLDTDLRYVTVSNRFCSDFSVEIDNVAGKTHLETLPGIGEAWRSAHVRCLQGSTERGEEEPYIRPDGSQEWFRWEMRPWYQDEETIGGILFFAERITRQVEDEARLRRSLDHQRLLLQELSHRINNNLQRIASFVVLYSQSPRVLKSSDLANLLLVRIEAIALVHRQLGIASDLSRVDIGEYLEGLCHLALRGAGSSPEAVQLTLDLIHERILFDAALPLGLAVLELLETLLAHVGNNSPPATLEVRLAKSDPGTLELRIAGNGLSGLSMDDPSRRDSQIFVYATVKDQLKGTIEHTESADQTTTVWVITFTDTQYAQRVWR